MPCKTFGQEMQEIRDETLLLSSMVEQAVMDSVGALRDNDLAGSEQILREDLKINRRRFEIEISIMVLMATHQPMAHDLRWLAASLHICTELERIGDYAKAIASINIRSQGISMPNLLTDIHLMAEKGVDMLHCAMTTFIDQDTGLARAIIQEDKLIDEWYVRLYTRAVRNVLGDPTNIERANHVIWAAHNLERLGDRVSNICEQVIYIVTGEHCAREDKFQPSHLLLREL